MVHGGPYPATSDARGTSVGTLAIERYLRPVCYQNYPDHLLPLALQNTNPLGIARLVNGEMSKAAFNFLKEFIQVMNSFLFTSTPHNVAAHYLNKKCKMNSKMLHQINA